MDDEQIVAKALLEIKAVHFYDTEPFRFTSGVLSPTHVDCRRLISFPKQRDAVIDIAEKKVREIGLSKIDYIAGGETAGIPYAAFLAARLNLPMIYIRKQPKGFGKKEQIEGFLPEGSTVLLIEDLMFDAGSKFNFKSAIQSARCDVSYVLCIFSYGIALAEERLRAVGLNCISLANWRVLLAEALETGYFSSSQANTIREFLSSPYDWSAK